MISSTRVPASTPAATATAPEEPHRPSLVAAILVAMPLLGILFLLGWGLLDAEPTIDESFSVLMATWSPTALANGIPADPLMATYHVVLFIWSALFGDSITALRAMSVVSLGVALTLFVYIADVHRRFWWGVVAAAGLVLTPVTREAFIDAKATAFGCAAVLVLIAVLLRLRSRPTVELALVASVMTLVVGTSHPSVFPFAVAALPVLYEVRGRIRRGNWILGVLGALVAFLALILLRQGSEVVEVVDSERFQDAMSQFLGANTVLAIGVLVLATVVVALRWNESPVLAWQALAGIGWVVLSAGTFLAGLSDLLYARYFAGSAVVILLFAASSVPRPAIALRHVVVALLAIVVLAGAASAGDDVRESKMHCTVAADLEALAEAGDIIEFVPGSRKVGTFGCLGQDRAGALAALTTMVPEVTADDLDDPREIWYGTDVPAIHDSDVTSRRLVIGTDELRAERVTELLEGGYECTQVGHRGRITSCTPTG